MAAPSGGLEETTQRRVRGPRPYARGRGHPSVLLPRGNPGRRGLHGVGDRSAPRGVSGDGPSGLVDGARPPPRDYVRVFGREQALSALGRPHPQTPGRPCDETRAAREPLPVRVPVCEEARVVLDPLRSAAGGNTG